MNIKVQKLTKKFKNYLAVNNINFSLEENKTLGLLGPNGCGKTTLFNLILGILKQDSGDIIVKNKKLNDLSIQDRATKFRIGYVPQNSSVFLGLTCEENIKSIAQICIKDKNLQEETTQRLLNEFNLEYLKNIKGNQLSGGEKKRLCISMALVNSPKILLLDEPFAALDLMTIDMIKKIITDLQKKYISVIISDHNAKDLMSVSDRCVIISNGEIVASGNPRQIINDTQAKKLYFGDNFSL